MFDNNSCCTCRRKRYYNSVDNDDEDADADADADRSLIIESLSLPPIGIMMEKEHICSIFLCPKPTVRLLTFSNSNNSTNDVQKWETMTMMVGKKKKQQYLQATDTVVVT